ncbi:inactive serine protease 35-like [Periophthalmus magnuspinnatus]|uniref:inactive serine protease 35-like n=1 Tax=Periophthalmus magnuspinnatus TaxID=409849 RepID=UPI00145AF5B9|nr:inactive serine protease 35-like [Periophthalmus magnuspinnatus]XP_055088013.1 inactive serine protease 35-like [Periophthalmus magnuspinnatus]
MALQHTLYFLLCVTVLAISAVHGDNDNNKTYFWIEQSLPILLETNTMPLNSTSFSKQKRDGEPGDFCGIECQSNQRPLDQTQQERLLGYETLHENGTCTHTYITLLDFNQTHVIDNTHGHTRRKRQVYGADGRFVISDSYFITNYPFSTAVRLSTGCSGVLVSPKHVLTAARCIHNGRDYLEDAKKLKVGVLQLKTKRRRGHKTRKKSEGNDQTVTEVDGRKAENGRRGSRRQEAKRIRRSVISKKQPVFRWTRVKETKLPQGWIYKASLNNSLSSDYNYALLELKRRTGQKYMDLGVAPDDTSMGRIHFSSFDTDKSHLDGRGKEKVVYRFCSVAKESNDLIYQHCDAQTGATGAGVYVRLRGEAGGEGGKGKWQRRVIGVYSGHQWVKADNGEEREYNVAVRITPTKYAQICHWIHGDPKLCKKI